MGKYYENLIQNLKDKTCDTKEWLQSLKAYKEYLEYYQEWLSENFERLSENFVNEFDEKINPMLASPLTQGSLKEILHTNDIRIIDTLDAEFNGAHDPEGLIGINVSELIQFDTDIGNLKKQIRHTFNHEAMHAVSAGKFLQRTKVEDTIDEDGEEVELHKIKKSLDWAGVQVSQYEGNKFTWLNEAITETLGSIVTGEDPTSYSEYIKLFNLVLEQGKTKIPPNVFYDAYFEKKGYLRDKNSDTNFWNILMERIAEAYPLGNKKFLVYLDDVVREEGIEKAIEIMENWNTQQTHTGMVQVE